MSSSGYVNAGCLLVISSSLSASVREDVLSSFLYAQLTSTKSYPEFKDFNAWNARCTEALKFLLYKESGRVGDGFFSSSVDKSVTFESLVRQRLTPLLAPDECCSLDLLLQHALSLGVQSPGLDLLTRYAVEAGGTDSGSAQVVNRIRIHAGVVDESATLRMLTINLATRTPIEPGFLNQSFMLSEIVGDVETRCVVAQLGEDYAEYKRKRVLDTLGGRREKEVERLY
ncbi:hypothetical protein [Pseudomonas sp. A-R-19]|uniref:hypothetical protein n=1 Tax=Pseudomonas sp. A-R-19 TaxID=2832403 RepID=UPI001CBC1F3B|nr:hypothetical protein [Pseudomonas sp. A-R-19]